jgi:Xaa-Pro aminopeptidase
MPFKYDGLMRERLDKVSKRIHDVPTPESFSTFMNSSWANLPLTDLGTAPAADLCKARRKVLSDAFKGIRVVIPSGEDKVRSNDTYYLYRPNSEYVYYTGVQGVEANPDACLVLEPNGDSHDEILFIMPRSTRDSDAFYRDARYGELWVGRRFTTEEAAARYVIPTRSVSELGDFLANKIPSAILREEDPKLDALVEKSDKDNDLKVFTSEQRLIKDSFEIDQLQKSVDASIKGFEDVVRNLKKAISSNRGERVVEGTFYARARLEGNGLGYNTIAAAGKHACHLHWERNDGPLNYGELLLLDAGVELDSYYTADVTRTLPINGKFTKVQRELYTLALRAQQAGIDAVKPGVTFAEINKACFEVLAKGIMDLGVLKCTLEEAMAPENTFYRRWTLHGVSHMLGLDVHDCAAARKENYVGPVKPGMVLTVEPGFYIQPDDEMFAPEFRGIGIRIEDDVLVTDTGCINLSAALPRDPDEIEKWMASLNS